MTHKPTYEESTEIFQRIVRALEQDDGTVFFMAPAMEALSAIILNYAHYSKDEGLAVETFIKLLEYDAERRRFLKLKG